MRLPTHERSRAFMGLEVHGPGMTFINDPGSHKGADMFAQVSTSCFEGRRPYFRPYGYSYAGSHVACVLYLDATRLSLATRSPCRRP